MQRLFIHILFSSFLLFNSASGLAQSVPDYSRKAERIASKISAGEYKNLHGFLVWKDGEILAEYYWDSWNRDRPHMLQSVTKSVTSILIGIAIQEGFIRDVRQRVLEFFPEYAAVDDIDEYKRALTLEDLLTMRTGMDWVEHPYQGSPLARMNAQRNDWVGFVLDVPMRESPGRSFVYNSGGVILLGGVIESAANTSVQEFARRYLFGPLGISTAEWWFSDRQGLPHTGGGLLMATKDLLKIGRLVLQRGQWNGQQIVNRNFVNEYFKNHQSADISKVAGYSRGYSLLWHVFPVNPNSHINSSTENFIAAWGAHGQWLMIFPMYNMAAIFIGGTQNFEEETQPIRIVYEELLGRHR